jgi:hypothetical protein
MAAAHLHDHGARGRVIGAYAALAGLSAAVLVRDPLRQTVFPPCPLHATTGLWCPACGATRASGLLLRGHPVEALHYNVLWVIAAPFVVYQLLAWGSETFGPRTLPRIRLGRLALGGMLAAIALFFVVRNLPGFDALNPLNGA